jgi:hypothetical protein
MASHSVLTVVGLVGYSAHSFSRPPGRMTDNNDNKKQALGRTSDNNKIDESGGPAHDATDNNNYNNKGRQDVQEESGARTRTRPANNDSKCTARRNQNLLPPTRTRVFSCARAYCKALSFDCAATVLSKSGISLHAAVDTSLLELSCASVYSVSRQWTRRV